MVRTEGLEPTCREALDPKSSASANFATSAYKKGNLIILHNKEYDYYDPSTPELGEGSWCPPLVHAELVKVLFTNSELNLAIKQQQHQ